MKEIKFRPHVYMLVDDWGVRIKTKNLDKTACQCYQIFDWKSRAPSSGHFGWGMPLPEEKCLELQLFDTMESCDLY